MKLTINGQEFDIGAAWREESLLHVLRENLGFVGAKFGCGVGLCGACTVLVDGVARQSCTVSPDEVVGARIETVEGLADENGKPHPVQRAWLEENVPQCGYCQAGQIMSAAALLRRTPRPSDADIDEAMSANLCRCGTQQRIRRAIHRAAEASS